MSHRNKSKMNIGEEFSGDPGLIGLNELDEEFVREELRNWALQYSKGETGLRSTGVRSTYVRSTDVRCVDVRSTSQRTTGQRITSPNPFQDIFEEIESQTSNYRAREPQKYEFPDWTKDMTGDPVKKPARPPQHTRRKSNNQINSNGPQTSTHVPQKPKIPPAPPIPEKWRAEWEWQERKRHAAWEWQERKRREELEQKQRERRAEIKHRYSPNFIINEQKARDNGNYAAVHRAAYPVPLSGDAARREAPRRANQRRRRAYDAVVLEDQQDRGSGKGRDNRRVHSQPIPVAKLFLRSDVRLPRSPGMINLAQEKPKGGNGSPDTQFPRNRPREAPIDLDSDDNECDFEEDEEDDDKEHRKVKEDNIIDRPFRDMAESYARSMSIVSEAISMGDEHEERDNYPNSV